MFLKVKIDICLLFLRLIFALDIHKLRGDLSFNLYLRQQISTNQLYIEISKHINLFIDILHKKTWTVHTYCSSQLTCYNSILTENRVT